MSEKPKTCVVIGSGGREHALAWKLLNSEGIERVDVIPGNPGMALTKGLAVHPDARDMEEWPNLIEKLSPEFVVIGPEKPLVAGLADTLREKDIPVIGPTQGASQLEGSKIFSKVLMGEFMIPTAAFKIAEHEQEALEILENWDIENKGIVIKADTLASGKGVVVTYDRGEAQKTVNDFLRNPDCVVKTDKLLFEEILSGEEVSVFALCDGESYSLLGHACDHKRLQDGDLGPNTGGMGAYLDPHWPRPEVFQKVEQQILKPLLAGMKRKGHPYQGFLFLGLMIQNNDPYVIEYNVRLGDPEAQTLLPLLKGDFASLCRCSLRPGGLKDIQMDQLLDQSKSAVHVVTASRGYPSLHGEGMETGHQVSFDKGVVPQKSDGPLEEALFFAGVGKNKAGRLMNTGGRVLGLTALGDSVNSARKKAYAALEKVKFEGMFFRQDIAKNMRGSDD